jgi:hypothetical protein
VIEATMKAYPSPKITMARWWLSVPKNNTRAIYEPAAYIMSQMSRLNEEGIQGYFYIYPTSMWAYFLTADEDAGIETAKRLWEPVLYKAAKYPGIQKPITQYANFDNFKQFFDWRFKPLASVNATAPLKLEEAKSRGISPLDSRLLSAERLSSPRLAAALREAMPLSKNGQLRGHLVSGNKVSRGGFDTSVNPAWRNARVHIISSAAVPNATSLKMLAPESGCYANEVS